MNTGKLRLLHLREQTEAVAETMATERERFTRLADPASAPRAVSAFNLFETPAPIAERMAALLLDRVDRVAKVLEPSAGLGRLYRAMRRAGHVGQMILVEQSPDCCRELYAATEGDKAASLRQGDFLAIQVGHVAGAIMNPPFKQGRDIVHIFHAMNQIEPGGRLVGLCYGGSRQERALRPLSILWEPLPPGSFKESGTRTSVVLLVIDKPF